MKKPAFTLLEMLIAITVFTIFVSFSIATYLAFHRADQEALVQRSLMLEVQGTMDLLSEAVRDSRIDYTAYSDESPFGFSSSFGFDDLLGSTRSDWFEGLDSSRTIRGSVLYLWNPEATVQTVYTWDEEEETLSMQRFDEEGKALADAVLLHNESTRVTYAHFRIFPDENPYDDLSNDAVQYQPTVQIVLQFAVPGRVREEITVDLQTSITSRFYR